MRDTRPLAMIALCMAGPLVGQQVKVDFGRDVLPIFRQNCIGCHGPAQAISGLRLDRRSSVFKDGLRRVVPGSTQNSILYHRLAGTEFGLQMPPTGKLPNQQIASIKAWIEQGAEWPDSLSNEAEVRPIDAKAIAIVEMLRSGNRKAFQKAIAENPKLLNARGPEGSTPFMYATLYGDAPLLERLLKRGADPNVKNDAGATALMWAAADLSKTRVLVAHGANVNAISDDLRTPLMIAAGTPGGIETVKLLLDRGANVNPTRRPDSESSPLIQAGLAADPGLMQMLIDHGADIKASGPGALFVSYLQDCSACVDLLIQKNLEKAVYTPILQAAALVGDAKTVRVALDHGAALDAPDPFGHTALAYAAGSDSLPAEVVQLLIDRGANVNSISSHQNSVDTGMSVLDIARLRGDTPVTRLLAKAGASSAAALASPPAPQPADSPRIAIERSLPLLQRADAGFTAKSGCISCHNDSLAAMTVGLARSRGFSVNEELSRQQAKVNLATLQHQRDLLHQGASGGGAGNDTFSPQILAYVLIGLRAEAQASNLDTDAAVIYIKSRQAPAGNWPYPKADSRPPLCSIYIGQTALAMHAMQLYRPKDQETEYDRAVARAASWIVQAKPYTTEDHLWRLLGLAWAGRDKDALRGEQRAVLALQHEDGGWADLPTMASNAYATGRALVALQASGLPVSDPAYQHGMTFLLKTQMADGSWFVQTRALGFQPYFETGFPHGVNQSISAAGTSWATMALILGLPPASTRPDVVAAAR